MAGKRYRNRATVADMIDELAFANTIDMMLLEGVSPRDVATFIQQEQRELLKVKEPTLINALKERRTILVRECQDDEDSPTIPQLVKQPQLPSQVAKIVTQHGLNEIVELEVMYLCSRDRIERMLTAEAEMGVFSDKMSSEFKTAGELLEKRFKMRHELGLIGKTNENDKHVTLEGYSKETSETLKHPESRRRVVSLIDRLRQVGKLPPPPEEEATEAEAESG